MDRLNLLPGYQLAPTCKPALLELGPRGPSCEISYAALCREVLALAAGLKRLGLSPGEGLLLPAGVPSRFTLGVLLACLRLGVTAVPLDPGIHPDVLRRLAGRLSAGCCVVASPHEVPRYEQRLPQGCRVICPQGAAAGEGSEWNGHPLVDFQRLEALPPPPSGDPPALILHTSGSTGEPVPVVYRRGRLAALLERQDFLYRQFFRSHNHGGEGALAAMLPVHHLSGLGFCLQALLMGKRLLLPGHFDPARCVEWIKDYNVPLLLMVPGMYQALMQAWRGGCESSRLAVCISGGEPLPPEIARRLERTLGVRVFSAYGMTECLSGIGHAAEDMARGDTPESSCGRLLFGEARLVDDQGRENPTDGELWVRNETTAPCYLNDELNQSKYLDGWFKTADVFHRDERGYYHHRGRTDHMFHVNGCNIHPQAVEHVLARHPEVEQAVAAPVNTGRGGVVTGAVVKPRGTRSTHRVDPAGLVSHCSGRCPGAAIPGWIMFAEDLPSLPNGKTDRAACRALLQRDFDRHARGYPRHAAG